MSVQDVYAKPDGRVLKLTPMSLTFGTNVTDTLVQPPDLDDLLLPARICAPAVPPNRRGAPDPNEADLRDAIDRVMNHLGTAFVYGGNRGR